MIKIKIKNFKQNLQHEGELSIGIVGKWDCGLCVYRSIDGERMSRWFL